ncbi:MAG: hypothetical protein KatS3mg071_2772 [Meiothermus sp.]|nr:MAG: hypothetical protein KatS3mg071_2772 [Meiothermus sp.]
MKEYVKRILKRGPATVETIAAELQITTPEALQALSQLELEGQVEEAGGRYRLASIAKPGQASSKGKSSGQPIRSREICRVVWFDEAGRFAKAPKALEPVEPIKPKVWRKTRESLKLEDGGRASIQRVNWEPVKVTYFPPKEVLEEVKAARIRGDQAYLEAYNRWKAAIEQEILEDVRRWDEEVTRDDPTYWERKAMASQKAQKAAQSKSQKRAEALAQNLPAKAKDELVALELKLQQVVSQANATKSQRKREALQRRKKRLLKAKSQLEKIAQGRAYKWPSAALLR